MINFYSFFCLKILWDFYSRLRNNNHNLNSFILFKLKNFRTKQWIKRSKSIKKYNIKFTLKIHLCLHLSLNDIKILFNNQKLVSLTPNERD